VVVTTYEMVKNPICAHWLVRSLHWSYLILDEGHVIKSVE
jgi:SNF2 family DNA or RNA helicase